MVADIKARPFIHIKIDETAKYSIIQVLSMMSFANLNSNLIIKANNIGLINYVRVRVARR